MLLGNKIDLLIKSAGLSRKEFGQICGVSGETVGEWVRNKSKPNKVALEKIIETFNVDIEKLTDDNFPLVQEGDKIELQYLNLSDYNLNGILNELNNVILNDYNLKFEDRLVDKHIRKIIADSILIGMEIAKQNILNENK
jgi:transcriptional regulator with XRE-family HTH domain